MAKEILKVAPKAADFIELSVDERAWLVLTHLKTTVSHHHTSNLLSSLSKIYQPELGSVATRHHIPENQLRQIMAEALARLVNMELVAIDFDQPAMFHFVTAKGKSTNSFSDFETVLVEASLSPSAPHKTIRKEAWPLYRRGKHDLAVFEAFKQVEVAVRTRSNEGDTVIGTKLMSTAFHPETGALSDQTIPFAERTAIMHLFMGAVGAFKNPNSHREVGLDDPSKAAELLMLASHLMRIVDEATP